MKKVIILLVALFTINIAIAQGCLPEGITFETQEQIDNFQTNYPECTEIQGSVFINGGNNIINLSGLEVMTSIGGCLFILNNAISNFSGLENLIHIGGDLSIINNYMLTSLLGLENLVSIGGDLTISNNNALIHLYGLESLISIGGNFYLINNPLIELNELGSLISIGSNLEISYNNNLISLSGLGGITAIGGYLEISYNNALTSLIGLENLVSIWEDLDISNNNSLVDLYELGSLIFIGSDLEISYNNNLTSLSGLEGITSIGGYLEIRFNGALTSLIGLDNIDGGSISNLYIHDNYALSNCKVQSVCDYLAAPCGTIEIYNNASGCNNPEEVAGACASCLPEGITFSTQAEINSFQVIYPGCTEIEGDVTITGLDITNLTGLNPVISIGGYLTVYTTSLVNFAGLDELTFIGNNLTIGIINGWNIYDNDLLESLTGLNALTNISGVLEIWGNPVLTSLNGLENLTSIGGLTLYGTALSSLSELENIDSCGNNLYVDSNGQLMNLSGLENLTSIGGNLEIDNNSSLNSTIGLNGLASIGGKIQITGNDALISLTGLENLASIGGDLQINHNPSLNSLMGLDNIDAGSIANLTIAINTMLSSCDIQSICGYLVTPGGTVAIYDNALGCNSPEEVEEHCLTTIEGLKTGIGITIIPNPSNDKITISCSALTGIIRLSIFNVSGEKVLERQLINNETQLDISDLPRGVYFVRLQNEKMVEVGKMIKK